MRNLSSEFKEQQNNGNRNYLKYADFTFTDGTTLPIADEDLWSNGLKFEDAVSQSGSFDIGAAIVNKLTLQINNFSGKFTDYVWDDARVVCHIGMKLSNGIEKIRICTMTVTDAPYQSTAIINLTCEDYMRKFDRDYSESKLTYPATRLQIVQDACNVCGVTLQSVRFDNDNIVVKSRPADDSITFRQVIAWVAQMGCQWARADAYGRLCLGWYEKDISKTDPDITAKDTNGFTPWLYDVEITGVKVTEYVDNSSKNEAKTYQSGKSDYTVEIGENKLIQEGMGETICSIIADRCVGMKFRPFSTSSLTNIEWEAGDAVLISDRKGNKYKSYLTSVTLNPGAFEQLECSAQSISKNKQKQYTLNQQVSSDSKKAIKEERNARENALKELAERLLESSGVYTTIQTLQDGSNVYYLHNKPSLSDSSMVWKMTAEAWAVSTDGGQHWNGGMTVDGDVIARILTANGINADWLNTGTIRAVDEDGNVTFLVDITTGRVVINADSIQIGGKNVSDVAKDNANTQINSFIKNTYAPSLNNIQSQIDGKIQTWHQDTDPSLEWSSVQNTPWKDKDGNPILDMDGNPILMDWEDVKALHEGDLWYNTTNNTQWIYQSGVWVPQDIPKSILSIINGKSSIYVRQPVPPYEKGDLWITSMNNKEAAIKTAILTRTSGDFVASDWINFKYVDKDDVKNAINEYDTSLGQDEIFNKLTNGGEKQGIYIEEGILYINAEFILAGILAGERINGRGLKVIDDNNNVTLEIDSEGNVTLAPKVFSLQGKTVQEIANDSASSAVNGQTQEDIFNKLTKNGASQGIYMDEKGDIYVNGEFIQAKGIRVLDKDGNTTFYIDKSGNVSVAASSFSFQNKSISEIAQGVAQEEIAKIEPETDNLLKGYWLSEDSVKKYWNTSGTVTYSQEDPVGGKQSVLFSGLSAGNTFMSSKITENPVSNTSGRYNVSFWMKGGASVYTDGIYAEVEVYFNGTLVDTAKVQGWKKYNYSVDVSKMDSSKSKLQFKVKAFTNIAHSIYLYEPSVTFGYTSSDIFNMLTNNGAIQGIYMVGSQLFVNGQYIKSLSIETESLAANAVTAEKMSVKELSSLGATIAGFAISDTEIRRDSGDSKKDNSLVITAKLTENEKPTIYFGGIYNSAIELSMDADGITGDEERGLCLKTHVALSSDEWTDGTHHQLGQTQFNGDVTVNGDFSVSSAYTKSIMASTDNYGEQAYYCYETPTPTIGDFGGGVIGEDGVVAVLIDDVFRESTGAGVEYYVFLQKEGEGQSWVSEKSDAYFIDRGTPGLRFAWELKAKQKNKEYIRFNSGKEDRAVDFESYDLESIMFGERKKIIAEMEGELL